MSGLRSALEEWIAQDLHEVHVDQLAEDLVELESAVSLLEAERVRRLNRYAEKWVPALQDGVQPAATKTIAWNGKVTTDE